MTAHADAANPLTCYRTWKRMRLWALRDLRTRPGFGDTLGRSTGGPTLTFTESLPITVEEVGHFADCL
jgi:hypothetical protein